MMSAIVFGSDKALEIVAEMKGNDALMRAVDEAAELIKMRVIDVRDRGESFGREIIEYKRPDYSSEDCTLRLIFEVEQQ